MKFYVLGYDGDLVVFMTRKVFDSVNEATKYAKGCAKAWRAFVVQAV